MAARISLRENAVQQTRIFRLGNASLLGVLQLVVSEYLPPHFLERPKNTNIKRLKLVGAVRGNADKGNVIGFASLDDGHGEVRGEIVTNQQLFSGLAFQLGQEEFEKPFLEQAGIEPATLRAIVLSPLRSPLLPGLVDIGRLIHDHRQQHGADSIPAEHDRRGGLSGVHHPLTILAALLVETLLALWIVLEAELYIGYGTSYQYQFGEKI